MYLGTVSAASLLCTLLLLRVSTAFDYQISWAILPYDDIDAEVDDTITFTYFPGTSDVYIHPTGDCDPTGAIFVGNSGADVYTFTDDDAGQTITFTTSSTEDCEDGQIIQVNIPGFPTSSPSLSTPMPTLNPTLAPTPTPTQSPTRKPTRPPSPPTTPSPTTKPTTAPTMAPTTPAPTRLYPNTPLKPVQVCFSGDMEVDVQDKGTVTMEMLQVGDFVKTGNGDTYEQVYAFGHRVPNKHTEFVQIHTNLDNPLEMTAEHLVFVEGKTNPVRAASIKVGDTLQAQDNHAVVQSIKKVTRNGIYSPLTGSGTIQVNGIIASTYVSFQKENNEYVELQGGIEIPMSHHDLAHIAMTPFRFYCTSLSTCDINDAESYMPVYVSAGIALVEWRKKQHIGVQVLFWTSIVMVIFAAMIMACTAALAIPEFLMSGKSIYQLQRIISLTSRSGTHLKKKIE